MLKNISSLLKVCPIEKIKIFKYNLILVVKPIFLFDILLFLKYHTLYQFEIFEHLHKIGLSPSYWV